MRLRLPRNFFSTVKGTDFIPDFYEDGIPFSGKVERESVIETVYNNNTVRSTLGKVDIIKKGWTDGWMRFRYKDTSISFYGLQESKRDVKPTKKQITKQLLQLLGYYNQINQMDRTDCRVFCINSAYFYGYILKEDVLDLIEDVIPLIQKASVRASSLYKECDAARQLVEAWVGDNLSKCHIRNLSTLKEADNFEINKVFREIYLNCL